MVRISCASTTAAALGDVLVVELLCAAAFSRLPKCARRLLIPRVRAKYASSPREKSSTMCRKSVSRLLIGVAVSRKSDFGLHSRRRAARTACGSGTPRRPVSPGPPGFRKWWASSMITASASSAIRSNRAGKSPLRPRSVWLNTARLLKSAAASTPPMCAEPLAQVRLPHRLLRGLRREQHDTLALVQDEPLDQHQPDERLAETDAVAEERAAVLAGDLHQRPVRLLLVAVELGEHLRLRLTSHSPAVISWPRKNSCSAFA